MAKDGTNRGGRRVRAGDKPKLLADEKYASVILRRSVEDTGNAEGVYVIRNGQQSPYADPVKEVETKEG